MFRVCRRKKTEAGISTSAAGEGDGSEDGLSAVAEGFSHVLKQPNYHLPKPENPRSFQFLSQNVRVAATLYARAARKVIGGTTPVGEPH